MNFKNAGLWVRLTAEESGLNFIQMENEIKPQIFSLPFVSNVCACFLSKFIFNSPSLSTFRFACNFFSLLSGSPYFRIVFWLGTLFQSIGRNGKRQRTLLYLCFVKINLWCTVIVTEPSEKIWPKGFSNEFECLFRIVRNADSWFFGL